MVSTGPWSATAPPPELEARTRLSRLSPVFVPGTARTVCAPAERWIGAAVPPVGSQAATVNAAPLTAAAVFPLTRTGSGRPSRVTRSERHELGTVAAGAGRCTPGMPSSATATGRLVGRFE